MVSGNGVAGHTRVAALAVNTAISAMVVAVVIATLMLMTACGSVAKDGPGSRSKPGNDVEVVVMAAASLFEAVAEVDQYFQNRPSSNADKEAEGVDVIPVTAGSSTLVAQLAAGARAEVLITADAATMRRAQSDGSVLGLPMVVATNHLVLATAPGNPGGITGLTDLARADLLVGLCATAVPCGALSDRVLQAAGINAAPDTLESNVRVLAGKIKLGELDAGLIYATDALALGIETVDAPALHSHANEYLMASVKAEPSQATQVVLDAFKPDGVGAAALRQLGFGPPP